MSDVLSTTDVLHAAGDTAHAIADLTPLFAAAAVCGPAVTCACAPADNLALHRALFAAQRGAVIVCDAGGNVDVGHFGELMALDAQGQGIGGLVIDGGVRDSRPVEELGFPVFHSGLAPRASRKERVRSVGEPVSVGGVRVAPGDQVIADRDAVLVVPKDAWREVRAGAEALREREAGIRAELARGRRLAELILLPEDDA